MEQFEERFLTALSCAVRSRNVLPTEPAPPGVHAQMIKLAMDQGVLPLTVQAESVAPDAEREQREIWPRRYARAETIRQASRTAEFLLLYQTLAAQDLHPAVMKGIVCRSLYPQPEQRPSVDEDLLVAQEELPRYHEALLAYGLEPVNPDVCLDTADEVAYCDTRRDLHLELHIRLFDSDASAYADCNRFFSGVLSRTEELPIYDVPIRTLAPTDHLLFLLCHAYKHVLHGGVGVRQICDIALFTERFEKQIDWERIRCACEDLRLELFAAALFRIGESQFGVPIPDSFATLQVDELPLLEDCLTGGLYGASDRDRQHSSTLTLEAVAANREERKSRGMLYSLFLPANNLEGRYHYLRRHRWLLPLAWVQRGWGYLWKEKSDPGKTLQIGERRIALLKQYRIIS